MTLVATLVGEVPRLLVNLIGAARGGCWVPILLRLGIGVELGCKVGHTSSELGEFIGQIINYWVSGLWGLLSWLSLVVVARGLLLTVLVPVRELGSSSAFFSARLLVSWDWFSVLLEGRALHGNLQ